MMGRRAVAACDVNLAEREVACVPGEVDPVGAAREELHGSMSLRRMNDRIDRLRAFPQPELVGPRAAGPATRRV